MTVPTLHRSTTWPPRPAPHQHPYNLRLHHALPAVRVCVCVKSARRVAWVHVALTVLLGRHRGKTAAPVLPRSPSLSSFCPFVCAYLLPLPLPCPHPVVLSWRRSDQEEPGGESANCASQVAAKVTHTPRLCWFCFVIIIPCECAGPTSALG